MSKPERHAEPQNLGGDALRRLEDLLREQLEIHERLLELIGHKRQAVREARIDAIQSLCEDEGVLASRLAAAERQRQALLEAMATSDAGTMTIADVAARAPEDVGARMLALAGQLRESVQRVQRESSIVRAAAEALSRHMSGVVQTVHSALSRARVYGRQGRILLGAQMEFHVDLKS